MLEEYENARLKNPSDTDTRCFNYLKNILTIKRFSHSLGLSSKVTIGDQSGGKSEVDTEGSLTFISISQLNNDIDLYLNSLKKNSSESIHWKMISDAYKFEENYLILRIGKKENAEDLYNRAFNRDNPQLTTIPCGWQGHDLTVAVYKDYLIVCNRGEGIHPDGKGTHVYKLTAESKKILNEQGYIKSLRPDGVRLQKDIIMSRLTRVVSASEEIAIQ